MERVTTLTHKEKYAVLHDNNLGRSMGGRERISKEQRLINLEQFEVSQKT